MILENLKAVRARIDAAARRSGRTGEDVELVAVTKYASPEQVRELLSSGSVRFLGENRVQNALKRREALASEAKKALWRFIGHLQTNKVKQVLDHFEWIDSIDSMRLAEAVDRRLAQQGRKMKALVQVKLAGSETQSGVPLPELDGLMERMKGLEFLEPAGVMAIAPFLEPVEEVRPYFRRAREAFEKHFEAGPPDQGPYLSLGMSRDFEIAVEEGANLVRIGTELFK